MVEGPGPADRVRPDRRRLLWGAGIAAAVGLAGCSRITGGEDDESDDEERESGEDGGQEGGGVEEGDN